MGKQALWTVRDLLCGFKPNLFGRFFITALASCQNLVCMIVQIVVDEPSIISGYVRIERSANLILSMLTKFSYTCITPESNFRTQLLPQIVKASAHACEMRVWMFELPLKVMGSGSQAAFLLPLMMIRFDILRLDGQFERPVTIYIA